MFMNERRKQNQFASEQTRASSDRPTVKRTPEQRTRIREGILKSIAERKARAAKERKASSSQTERKKVEPAPYDPVALQFVRNSLGDRNKRTALLKDNSIALEDTKKLLDKFSVRRIQITVDYLLRVVANNNDEQIRNAAIKILDNAIPWNKVDRFQFKDLYFTAVASLLVHKDLKKDNIQSLLHIGVTHAAQFPQKGKGRDNAKVGGQVARELAKTWMDIAKQGGNINMWREIALSVYDMQQVIILKHQLQKNIERRRAILFIWQEDMDSPSLQAVLANQGIHESLTQIESDIKHFQTHGIYLPRQRKQIIGVESAEINQAIEALYSQAATVRDLYDLLKERNYTISMRALRARLAGRGITMEKENVQVEDRRSHLRELSGPTTSVKDLVDELRRKGYTNVTKSTVENDIRLLAEQGVVIEVKRRPTPSQKETQVFP